MANSPTIGVFIPGYLNTCNSPGATGQQDAYGQNYSTGLNSGKMIQLGYNESNGVAAPGTTLYSGSYQWVKLDSSATVAYASQGYAAYIRLDSGATQGALPETGFSNMTVTTADVANTLGLNSFFCGVFINPVAYVPTPGNWCFIFVGGGRAAVQYGATANATLGDAVYPDTTHTGLFLSATTPSGTVVKNGIAVTVPAANTLGIVYFPDIMYRLTD